MTNETKRCDCMGCKGSGRNDVGGPCLCRWSHDHEPPPQPRKTVGRMAPKEHERRLLGLLSRVLEAGRYGDDDETEARALLGDDLWVTQALLPRLLTPPLLCGACGGPFRSALVGTGYEPTDCHPCRERARAAAQRAEIEAEIRAQMVASGEF